MMHTMYWTNQIPPWTFDAELLRRYDRPGPRYTSYPTAPHFQSDFDALALATSIEDAQSNAPDRSLSIYIHVPFCVSPCFYCACNRVVTRDKTKSTAYVQRILREASFFAKHIHKGREVAQLHFGGGTPNFLGMDEMGALLEGLQRHFRFAPPDVRDFSIELDPRTLSFETVASCAKLGFNRVSLGIQDFDPHVQSAINRVQDPQHTLACLEEFRQSGIASINVDLIYGLPLQTVPAFRNTLERIVAAQPDRLAVYGYAHLPHIFPAQKKILASQLPSPKNKLALLEEAVLVLTRSDYHYIGMDHFAKATDPLARALYSGDLHRNFMGYTTHADTDLIGLGVSAISHIGNSYSQNPRTLPEWESAIDAGNLAVWRGLVLSQDDQLRADIIHDLMCHGRVDGIRLAQKYAIDFSTYFATALNRLQQLEADGLVHIQSEKSLITITGLGRPLVRVVAMCFDKYISQGETTSSATYSKTI